jgi:hypothetical protein
MKFTLTKFVVVGTFVGVVVAGIAGVEFWRFQERNMEPQNIQQRAIEQKQLSPARDLTGIWKGEIDDSEAHPGEAPYCSHSATLTLNLTQNGNTLNGNCIVTNSKVTHAKMTAAGPLPCGGSDQKAPEGINNGQVNASSFGFDVFGVHVTGSFTADLMSGQDEFKDSQTIGTSSFKLTRQAQ